MEENLDLEEERSLCSESPCMQQATTMKVKLEHLIQIVGLYEPTPDGITDPKTSIILKAVKPEHT